MENFMKEKLKLKELYGEERIKKRILELAKEINNAYRADEIDIVCICVLRGAVLFFSELVKHFDHKRILMDFIRISSYGDSQKSSGQVQLIEGMSEDISNKHLLIVEDIIDSGLTIDFLRDYFTTFNPLDIKVVALLDKRTERKVDVDADYTGFILPTDAFVVGYGLDYKQYLRNLGAIYEIEHNNE